MNALIKSTWLAVLASDAYQSGGTGYLRSRPTTPGGPCTYSSLGVLVELARQGGVEVGYVPEKEYALPDSVAKWAEMEALPWMRVAQPSGIFNLAYLNKLGGGSFDLEAAAITEFL